MYENFYTCVEKQINKNLYYGNKYHVEKEIISTWLYHSEYRKIFRLKFHIARIKEGIDIEKAVKQREPSWWILSGYGKTENLNIKEKITVSDEDLSQELKIYCPNPEQKGYMFMEVYHKDKIQPPYFAFAFFSFLFRLQDGGYSINKINSFVFENLIKQNLEKFLQAKIISRATFFDFFGVIGEFGDLIVHYMDRDLGHKFIDIRQKTNKFGEFIKKEQADPVFSSFLIVPYISFLKLLEQDKQFLQCEFCGQIMAYAKDKKYCSLITDGHDCAKKARNQRAYQNKKLVNT